MRQVVRELTFSRFWHLVSQIQNCGITSKYLQSLQVDTEVVPGLKQQEQSANRSVGAMLKETTCAFATVQTLRHIGVYDAAQLCV